MGDELEQQSANIGNAPPRKKGQKQKRRGRDAQILFDTINIGNFLRIQRTSCGLSQKEVAIRMQTMGFPMTESVVCEIESRRMDASVVQLATFAIIYEFDFAELFDTFFRNFLVRIDEGDFDKKVP